MSRVAIIGGGVTGLTAAALLTQAGFAVTVYDKGGRIGGRLATRDVGDLKLNHGPVSFSASDPAFADQAAHWARQGLVSAQDEGGRTGFRLTHPARTLAQTLAGEQLVQTSTRVDSIRRHDDRWLLRTVDGEDIRRDEGPFEALLLTCPAPQAQALLADLKLLPESLFLRAQYQPQWTMMAQFITNIDPGGMLNGAFDRIDMIAGCALVAQASKAWTEENLALERPEAAQALLRAIDETFPNLPPTSYLKAHRWLYANVLSGPEERSLWLANERLALAGDWFAPRGKDYGIQTAWLSGRAAAQAIISTN